MAHMKMTMAAENCTVGGKRLNVMVLHTVKQQPVM
jgi:hypothetical protein